MAAEEVDGVDLRVILHYMNYLVVFFGAIFQLPNILNVFRSQSAEGISISGLILEYYGFCLFLCYNFAKLYPVATYMEFYFLVLQDTVLLLMVLHYTSNLLKPKTLVAAIVFYGFMSTLGQNMLPENVMTILSMSTLPAAILSKVSYLTEIIRKKNSGQLSAATWTIAVHNNIVRAMTTWLFVGDIPIFLNYFVCMFLNASVLFAVVYYRPPKVKAE